MVLYIDHYDSFANTIVDYLTYLNVNVRIKKTDEDIEDIAQYTHIIIGPGPGHPNELLDKHPIISYCEQQDIPLLGICLGHQLIAQYYGSKIIKADGIFHGKNSRIIQVRNSKLYENHSSKFVVTRYHSLVVDQIVYPLETISITDNNEIMGFEHNSKNIFGVQYHPEAYLTDFGLEALKKFLAI